MGVKFERVEVDVEALVAWAKAKHRAIDQKARAEYVADWLQIRGAARPSK